MFRASDSPWLNLSSAAQTTYSEPKIILAMVASCMNEVPS
jgi:hypothetical protein